MRFPTYLLLLAVGGCQLSAPRPPMDLVPLPERFSEEMSARAKRDPHVEWWRAFQDPVLDRLLATGMEGNLDLAQATARIKAADAEITGAGAGAFPTLTLGMQHNILRETGKMKKQAGNVHTSALGVSASWLVDLFGEVRSQTDAAKAQYAAAVAGAEVARLAVISGIANAYVDAQFFQESARIVSANLASRRRTLQLTQAMRAEGVASELDVARASASVGVAEAELPGIEANYIKALNRIATLSGRPASDFRGALDANAGQPVPRWGADAGVPADLMRNRPDIRQAESEFVSAMADIGYAWSQLFPSITLSGNITPSYVRTAAKAGSLTTWSFGPTLRLPIFDGGRLRANVTAALARAEQKQIAWRSSILTAVEEVENALVAYKREHQTYVAQSHRIESTTRAVKLSRMGYEAGMLSLIEVLDSERVLLESQTSLAQSRRALAQYYVALNISVGRGLAGPGQSGIVLETRKAEKQPAH